MHQNNARTARQQNTGCISKHQILYELLYNKIVHVQLCNQIIEMCLGNKILLVLIAYQIMDMLFLAT